MNESANDEEINSEIHSLTDIDDYKDILIDEDILAQAYQFCSIGRIAKEREF